MRISTYNLDNLNIESEQGTLFTDSLTDVIPLPIVENVGQLIKNKILFPAQKYCSGLIKHCRL